MVKCMGFFTVPTFCNANKIDKEQIALSFICSILVRPPPETPTHKHAQLNVDTKSAVEK